MAFMVSKSQPSFSETEERAVNVKQQLEEDKDVQTLSPITSHLYLKSSARSSSHETLDKEAVLRRIRHHKSLNRVRTALQALAGGSGKANGDQMWMELSDDFSCP
ncbi:hypothetical protein SLE2022_302720 [Rubroshorea leprosula]